MKKQNSDSILVADDQLTSSTYSRNNFNPNTETEKFSYTSHRVSKPVYNTYEKTSENDFKVFGYYTDWSQYDGRLDNPSAANADCGRGVDIKNIPSDAYDKIIIGFLGIVGDKGQKEQTINTAATCGTWPSDPSATAGYCRSQHQATFTDPWGDVLSYRNCGFNGWVSNDVQSHYNQQSAQGVLGALSRLTSLNPELRIGISIGGWTMSNAFYELARDEDARKTFVDSIIEILDKFPMITDIDLDWEYPGLPGNTGNQYDDNDHTYFAQLVSELRNKLDAMQYATVKISIAANAGVKGLEKANIPAMIAAGVDGINLMTYDYFGTPWAEALAHHTNIHAYGNPASEYSIEAAVQYLQSQQVDLSKVYIGYAAYSRGAKNAVLESKSPLAGEYDPGGSTTTGSFESGATEWYDIIYNYLDLESKKGRNGYVLLTDEEADADYLYNDESQHFMSIDTPRTVKAKGEFVRKYGLGGLFTWTIDMDNGILVNAAREGLNATIKNQVIDMSSFYFKGENVEDHSGRPVSRITGKTNVKPDETILLSGQTSTNAVQYQWDAEGLTLDQSSEATFKAHTATPGEYPVQLTVFDSKGRQDQSSVTVSVALEKPMAKITGNTQIINGDLFSLSGEDSTNTVAYSWSAKDFSFDGDTEMVVEATATTNGHFTVELTVTGPGGDQDSTSVILNVSDEVIPQWKAQAYKIPGTKVRNDYQGEGEKIYSNGWYAEAYEEPGDPLYTGETGSGKVWSVVK